jgi:nitrite reductase (NADH) small subunit
MNATSEGWIEVCSVDQVPQDGARVVERGRGVAAVAIFRCGDGALFALEDLCPHRGGPLSQGIVYGHRVACPLHNWSIELASGEAVAPDQGSARSYPVRVAKGRIWLQAAALASAGAAPAPPPCPASAAGCARAQG